MYDTSMPVYPRPSTCVYYWRRCINAVGPMLPLRSAAVVHMQCVILDSSLRLLTGCFALQRGHSKLQLTDVSALFHRISIKLFPAGSYHIKFSQCNAPAQCINAYVRCRVWKLTTCASGRRTSRAALS